VRVEAAVAVGAPARLQPEDADLRLELGDGLRDIYRTNFPKSVEIGGDITGVSKESLDAFVEQIGQIDAIIGGPPCQGFSLSGKRRVDDPRNSLFRHYLRFVDAFQPKIAVLENVRLLTSMKSPNGGYVKDEISSEFKSHGYSVRYFEIDAMNFGVPQHRDRVMFVAVREDTGLLPSIPLETHGNYQDLFSGPSGIRVGDGRIVGERNPRCKTKNSTSTSSVSSPLGASQK
jgi:DNA (cytosine-5)-methyltransferase 1